MPIMPQPPTQPSPNAAIGAVGKGQRIIAMVWLILL